MTDRRDRRHCLCARNAKSSFYTTTRFDSSRAMAEPQMRRAPRLRDIVVEDHRRLRLRLRRPERTSSPRISPRSWDPQRVRRARLQRRAGGRLVRQARHRRPGARRDELQPSRPVHDCQQREIGRQNLARCDEFTHTLSEPSINFGCVYTKVVRLTPGKPQMTISHVHEEHGLEAHRDERLQPQLHDHRQASPARRRVAVPWPMTRAAGRGGAGGRARPVAQRRPGGRPAKAARRRPYAPLAAGEPWARSTVNSDAVPRRPAGNKLVYSKVLEGSECYRPASPAFARSERQRHPHREQESGAGVHITGDRPLTRLGYWSIRTVLAPEPYIDLNIEPGQQFASTCLDYYTTK